MQYEVSVGNIGTVYNGTDRDKAYECFECYVGISERGEGRASGESVAILVDGDIIEEHPGIVDILESMRYDHMVPRVWRGDFATVDDFIGPYTVVDLEYLELNEIQDGTEITIHRDKWGAQLSAPGFMDQTDITVHDTEFEAMRYLAEMCGDA
jgi:hypothetical protein